MTKFLNVLMEERKPEQEAVGFFGNWAKWSIEQKAKEKYNWRYENSITNGKYIEIDGDYSQWRTNNILAKHKNTIHFANVMNRHYNITDQMHYDYLYYSVPKSNRYSKAETKEEKKQREKKEELISLISEHYKYNATRAKEVLKILTAEQIDSLRKQKEKGGTK